MRAFAEQIEPVALRCCGASGVEPEEEVGE